MAEEKTFENKIKKYLDSSEKAWHFKYWAGPMSKAGIPDIIGCVNGFFVGIEVKASNGRPSPLQVRNVRLINESGGFAVIVYPKQFEQLKDMIDSLGDDRITDARKIILKYF